MRGDEEQAKTELRIERDFQGDSSGCSFCTETMIAHTPKKQLNLIINNDYVQIELCPYHEVTLLSRMLNNWARRKRRRKNPWPIPKEELCFICGDILEDSKEPEEDSHDATD